MNRNPYFDENGTPVLKRSVFAFLDILGYREILELRGNKSADFLQTLYPILSGSRSLIDSQEKRGILSPLRDEAVVRSFTDNIVLGWPVESDGEAELSSAVTRISFFQAALASLGLFVRGAISIGDAFVDELVVYGEALLSAYKAESEVAFFPRVILTQEARDAVQKFLKYNKNSPNPPQSKQFLKDADGQFFVNYLGRILSARNEQGQDYDRLVKHKISVERKLTQHVAAPKIHEKYVWAATYHNFFCGLNPEYANPKYLIGHESIIAPIQKIC